MDSTPRFPAVTPPVAILTIVNAVLFAIGALLHIGVQVGPLDEAVSVPVMILEISGSMILGLATMGIFTGAAWARRLAAFANAFAILAVVAIVMLVGVDTMRVFSGGNLLKAARVILAAISLVLIYQPGRARRGH